MKVSRVAKFARWRVNTMAKAEANQQKRKYRFPTRMSAEEAYVAEHKESMHRYRAMLALYLKQVTWLATRGDYKVGMFDEESANGPRVLVVFAPKVREQAPALTAADAYEWARDTRQSLTHASMEDNEARGVVELCDLVAARLHELTKKKE